jgi:hypothetical protein
MDGSAPTKKWTKSSHSGQQDCVEYRKSSTGADVRDSKQGHDAPYLTLTPDSWTALLAHLGRRD